MIAPQFLRFYGGYTRESMMSEFAITFFSFVNSMYRLEASEKIDLIEGIAIGNAEPKDRSTAISALQKSAMGLHGIVKEVRNIKKK